ncbi:DddA-like double-stranded DNA deaminase toxin [Kribbella sp. NPDC056345]|uniref:DddA-like double-stranded DNA deaminase toxin n=1 Tax=Kribbella sp. NPDC056345 TaxID=3345789 RepID=UPI0035DB641F
MPSELQRVAQALLAVLDETPRVAEYLQRVARKCREDAGHVGQLSNHPAARLAAMQLADAATRCEEAARYLSQVPPRARSWAEHMVAGGQHDRAAQGEKSGYVAKEGAEPRSERSGPIPAISDEEAGDLFRKLPVRVERRGHREKTSGLWRDPDGNEQPLLSGVDHYREMADRLALDKNLGDPPHTLAISSHVEIKFALMMRERGLLNETIVVNKNPCDGDLGCDQMLPRFLPAGGSLTVYGPAEFKRTYRAAEQDG